VAASGYRFFCDANDLALGRGLAQLRRDVLFPGHPELPDVVPGTKDPVWIQIVSEMGLVVITRDKRIRRRPAERLAWREGGLRGFVLTGAGRQPTWESARIDYQGVDAASRSASVHLLSRHHHEHTHHRFAPDRNHHCVGRVAESSFDLLRCAL